MRIVQTEVEVGDGITQQVDAHIVARIGQGILTRAKELQNRDKQREGDDGEEHTDDGVECHHIAEYLVGHLVVTLAEQNRDEGSSTRTYQSAKRCREIHNGDGDGQARNSHRANALTDKNRVDDVVERRCCHRNNGRESIGFQQLTYLLSAK